MRGTTIYWTIVNSLGSCRDKNIREIHGSIILSPLVRVRYREIPIDCERLIDVFPSKKPRSCKKTYVDPQCKLLGLPVILTANYSFIYLFNWHRRVDFLPRSANVDYGILFRKMFYKKCALEQGRVNDKFWKLLLTSDFGKKVDIRKIDVLNHFKHNYFVKSCINALNIYFVL